MKKFFRFALLAVAAGAVVVGCNKNTPTPTPEPTPDPGPVGPVDDYTGPVTGDSDWSIIGSLTAHDKVRQNWDNDIVMVKDGDIYFVKNLMLAAADEFKIRFQKGWDANRGGAYAELGQGFAVENNGANIKPGLDGIYDVYYNAEVEQMAVVAKDGTPQWAVVPPSPSTQNWDYVMNISSYKTNSEFHFDAPITVNPSAITFQWKFYPTEWNDYDKVIERDGESYKVWANRLGQISNSSEKGLLFRFCDGGEKGQLRFNSDVLGTGSNDYVVKDGKAYIWELNKWHVLTITADGTTVSVYDNADLLYTFAQNTPETLQSWKIDRFDISMTWDDGTGYDKGQAFRGYIAYTRLFDVVLSQEEIAKTLCDAETTDNLLIYWAWNCDEGAAVKNLGVAAGYDLDFTKALAGGQQSYVKAEDIEATWTDVTDVDGMPAVCAE